MKMRMILMALLISKMKVDYSEARLADSTNKKMNMIVICDGIVD